jgi:hypothetical protein
MLKEIEKRGIMMTENLDSEHIQFFTLKKFQNLIGSCNLIIEKSEKSCFIAGPFSNQIIKHFPVIIDINVNKITRFIPFRLCSGWYFIARKK